MGEIYDVPPVSPKFAARLGIRVEDLQEGIDQSSISPMPLLAMIDSPGHFSTLARWEQYLSDLRALPPDTLDRQELIERAERIIAYKRQEVEKPSEQDDYFENPILDAALKPLADHNKKAATAGFKPDYSKLLIILQYAAPPSCAARCRRRDGSR